MLRRLLLGFIAIFAVICAQTAAFAPSTSAIEIINRRDKVCNTDNAASEKPQICGDRTSQNPLTGPDGVITSAVRIISTLIGIVAIIVIIIAGIKYMTANGDSNGVGQARNAIIFAAVGLAIAVTARAIVELVLTRLV